MKTFVIKKEKLVINMCTLLTVGCIQSRGSYSIRTMVLRYSPKNNQKLAKIDFKN